MAIADADWRKVKELVMVLAGQQGDGTKAAVRASTVKSLQDAVTKADASAKAINTAIAEAAKVTITPASQGHATTAPTMGQFNLLMDDTNALRSQLEQIVSALSK